MEGYGHKAVDKENGKAGQIVRQNRNSYLAQEELDG